MVCSFCFSSLSQVTLASGETRNVSSLRPYEQLETVRLDKTGKAIKLKSSPFYTYLHFEKDVLAEFLVLSCENGSQLVISAAHLLFKKSADKLSMKTTMAKNVEVGDYLLYVNSEKEIQNVKVIGIDMKTLRGVFAPLTKSGSLIVDGFLVSSYAHVDSHSKAHASMAPLRFWYQIHSKIGKAGVKRVTKDGIHAYAKALAALYGLA